MIYLEYMKLDHILFIFIQLGFLPFVDLNFYCAVNQVRQIFKQQLLIGIIVSELCWKFLYKMNKITTC